MIIAPTTSMIYWIIRQHKDHNPILDTAYMQGPYITGEQSHLICMTGEQPVIILCIVDPIL